MEKPTGILIKQIHDWLEREANQMLRDMDLTLVQGRTMLWLRENGGEATQKEVEAYLSVAHPTAVGILHRLEAKGLITCRHSGVGRRAKVVRMVEKGDGFFRGVSQSQTVLENNLLSALSQAEREDFRRMLEAVCGSLDRLDESARQK